MTENAKTFLISDLDAQQLFGQQIVPPRLSKNFSEYLETFQCLESFKSGWKLSRIYKNLSTLSGNFFKLSIGNPNFPVSG